MIELVATFGLTLVLLRLVWIDIKTLRLPDVWTIPLIMAGVFLSVLSNTPGIAASLIGGAVGYTVFWAVGAYYFRRTGREGLGLGDAKLFAACGTWLGYMLLPYVLLISTIAALAFALTRRSSLRQQIAFGPWLALGFWLIWVAQVFGL